MEAAPRRPALRGGRTGHRESSSTLWIPSFDPRDETERACEFYFGSSSGAITMSLGSMATGISHEWMCTPAKEERAHSSWKRMRVTT